MNLNGVLRKYGYCWKETVAMMRRPRLLLPFFLLALCQACLLLCLVFFMKVPLSFFMVDMVRIVGGEAALHYPVHFLRLPYLYHVMVLPIAVFGFVLYGWGVFMIADYFDGTLLSARQYLDKIVWNVPSFLAIGILFTVLGMNAPYMLSLLARHIDDSSLRFAVVLIAWAFGIGVKAVLVYSTLFVKIYRDELPTAIRMSARFSAKRPALTVMILLTVWILHAPLEYLTEHPGSVAKQFGPERIAVLMFVGLLLEIFTSFYLFASTTCLAIGAAKRRA